MYIIIYIYIYILYITELRPPNMQRMLQDRASRRPENGLGTQLQLGVIYPLHAHTHQKNNLDMSHYW